MISYILCILVLIFKVNVTYQNREKEEIVIAGLFPVSQEMPIGRVGRGVWPAVEMALQMINNNSDILDNYVVKITKNDTKCDMALATRIFFDIMASDTTFALLFGDACSNVTGPLAQISKWWNIYQITYADTDPKLSDRSTYRNLFRTVPSDSDYNSARLSLLKRYNWLRVGTLYQDASVGSDRYAVAHSRLVDLLRKSGIEVEKSESFRNDPLSAIKEIFESDVRIIIGYFDIPMTRKVFCHVYKVGLYGAKYLWILLGDADEMFFLDVIDLPGCRKQMIMKSMEGAIVTDVLPVVRSKHVTVSGLTAEEYINEYDKRRGMEYSKYHGYAFDTVWVIAHALNKVMMASSKTNTPLKDDSLAIAINETNFLGVTGRLLFDGSDRIGYTLLQQVQAGKLVNVGEYSRLKNQLVFYKNLQWLGHGPPRDRKFVRTELKKVPLVVYVVMCTLASFGIIMGVVFLSINIIFRNHRYIKMSSPNLNNLIIVGCLLSYGSIFLLEGHVQSFNVKYICSARSWILSIAFSLSFGAMFSKTWRVHAIFTNIKFNKKVIKDYKLLTMVLVLVAIDACILTTWEVIDPIDRKEKNLSSKIEGDFEVIPVVEFCTSESYGVWLGILYAFKGLLLLFGCFLAWETRQVTIPALNDSKYIGMSVYNVVIMCICGAAITVVIKDQPTKSFVIIGLLILFSTSITLFLLFLPKIIVLRKDPHGHERRMRATIRKKNVGSDDEDNNSIQQKTRKTVQENKELKEMIKKRKEEIQRIMRKLGEDEVESDEEQLEFKTLAPTTDHDESECLLNVKPIHSLEMDTISSDSDISACITTIGAFESPQLRQRHIRLDEQHLQQSMSRETSIIDRKHSFGDVHLTVPGVKSKKERHVVIVRPYQPNEDTLRKETNPKYTKNQSGNDYIYHSAEDCQEVAEKETEV